MKSERGAAMKQSDRKALPSIACSFSLVVFFLMFAATVVAGEYDNALKGVKGIKVVFDVSQGSPGLSNVLFWAVQNVYEDEAVRSLPDKPQAVVVFQGPAVKLLSMDRSLFKEDEYGELDKFHDTIRQMKKDGVTFEVCLYAAKVLGVDPDTIMLEIDRVGNGFISVAGYQAQGYSLIRIP
jgi:intracellular sulfur oxidation DsrE/DsrF family protein